MASILKVVGVLSCGFLLYLGLSDATQASNGNLAEDEMKTNQSERYGRQAGVRGDHDTFSGCPGGSAYDYQCYTRYFA
jgi:hypothetical protein